MGAIPRVPGVGILGVRGCLCGLTGADNEDGQVGRRRPVCSHVLLVGVFIWFSNPTYPHPGGKPRTSSQVVGRIKARDGDVERGTRGLGAGGRRKGRVGEEGRRGGGGSGSGSGSGRGRGRGGGNDESATGATLEIRGSPRPSGSGCNPHHGRCGTGGAARQRTPFVVPPPSPSRVPNPAAGAALVQMFLFDVPVWS